MTSVVVSCDGKQFTLSPDVSQRMTDFSGGTYAEAYWFVHSPEQAEEHGNYVDLEPIIHAMTNARKVSVRFTGDGNADYVLPASHIKQAQTLWDIWQVLDRDPALISYLQ